MLFELFSFTRVNEPQAPASEVRGPQSGLEARVAEFLKLFHSDEARLYAEIAWEDTQLCRFRNAASYWVLAYQIEKEFRDREAK